MKIRPLLRAFALVLGIAVHAIAGLETAPEALFAPESGFGPDAAEAALAATGPEAVLSSRETLAAGWHVLEAEYKVESADQRAVFRIEARPDAGSHPLTRPETFACATDWTPLRVHMRLERPAPLALGFSQLPPGARLLLRSARHRPYAALPEENLLLNGDFSRGSPGGLPSGWKRAGYGGGQAAEHRLVSDTSFRNGNQIMRLSHNGEGAPRIIESALMPLPTSGRLTLSFWARAPAGAGALEASLFGDNWTWQYQVMDTFTLTSAWRKFTVSGPCPGEIAKDPFFFARFDLTQAGQADIAAVSVAWSDRKPEEDAGWIGAPGKNLLLNPDFELGWTGWYLDHFSDWAEKRDTRIAMSRGEPTAPVRGAGLEGGTALRPTFGSALVSYAVPIETGRTYTVSAYFKALRPNAHATLYFISTDWHLHQTGLRDIRSDRWERRSLTFKWDKPLLHPRGYVRIDADGLLVDRVQLEKGQLGAYEPPPVTLGLEAGEKNYFVRGRDTPRLTLRALPAATVRAPYLIVATAKNVWDGVVWEKRIHASPGRPWVEAFAPSDSELGTFSVELKAVDAAGAVIGVGTARYAIIEPPPAPAPGESLFGMHHETATTPSWYSARMGELFADLGVGWNRFFFREGDLGLHPDKAWIEAVRQQLAPLNRQGVRQIGCVGFYPAELARRVIDANEPDPDALQAYGEHLGNLVAELRSDLRYWEILNEPNLWRHDAGPESGRPSVPPEKYVEILKVAHQAIKRVDPGLMVVGGCVNGTDWPWLRRVLELGGARYMDVFSFHSYRSAPDAPGADTHPDLLRYRALLDEHGFTGPMINSEQYFAADLYQWRGNPDEVRRGYYVPGREERRAAARTIRNYIHHAAAGVPYCAFAVEATVGCHGGGQPFFLHDLFGAYSAAVRLLSDAGRGEMLPAGPALRVFLFSDAPAGPLATVNAPSPEFDGRMRLAGDFQAYDFNGNPIPPEELDQGIPVRVDPVYLRFPRGTPPARIRSALLGADLLGLGAPFRARVALSGEKELSVFVTNRRNHSHDGEVRLEAMPGDWSAAAPRLAFAGLGPGETRRLPFILDQADIQSMRTYPVSVLIGSGEDFLRQTTDLRPVSARRLRRVSADGDLAEWRDAAWLRLGEAHLSADFSPGLPRKGDDDLSARVAIGWHDDHLAVAAEVRDDHHAPASSAANASSGDSLQVYIDQLGDGATRTDGYGPDDIAYTLAMIDGSGIAHLDRAGSERYIGESNRSRGLDREVEVSVVRHGRLTIYEARFPRAVLPEARPGGNAGLRLSLLINDNDGSGRKVGLTLSPPGTDPEASPAGWASLLPLP